ncbi:glycosyltransferase 87 family protein [Marisediminicola antarctica]|uniref:glycosyltransferase 87 family protein n=1 Tax=Marisediminicola antarctica TaxID=674079 RepID=UPI00192A4204
MMPVSVGSGGEQEQPRGLDGGPADAPWRRAARASLVLWAGFLLVHAVLIALNIFGYGWPLGDITVYRFWTDQATGADYWVGIDAPWVYPILALVPMLAAQLGTQIADAIPALSLATVGPDAYVAGWLVTVTLLNALAFGVLTGRGTRPGRAAAGWWWLLFLLALGPIALGRIDSVTVSLSVVAVTLIASRPRVAALILTIAAWIKVWPGAIVIAIVAASRDRWRVLATAVGASIAVVAVTLSFGSGANVFSFVTEQTGRGLQVEAPVTTAWMWLAWAGLADASVYYDDSILTWQVSGEGTGLVGSLMTPVLLLAVAAITAVALVSLRRGADAAALLPPLVLALLTGMIAFQKVGSPQFISWLAVPVILGLVTHSERRGARFVVPAALVVLIAGLTHVIYPYLYGYLLGVFPAMLLVLTLRNLLLFVVLGWAVVAIVSSAPRSGEPGDPGPRERLRGARAFR